MPGTKRNIENVVYTILWTISGYDRTLFDRACELCCFIDEWDWTDLLGELETQLNITIAAADVERSWTIGELIDYLEARLHG